ncbi:hypothetical protein LTR37_007439 [Vermiconidia calcicola]|uniref:Uncharacterized protein n=1 Tax=Vermiconidia calcicola TaxID=1690605 RepID=A0ACC3NEX9_9PEZI|nr:hypothetical protein LTR37_007439 [Vermiconidia calcicola]
MGSIRGPNGQHADLPKKDSLELQLVVATQEEHIHQQKVNCVEWKGALSPEAYLRREEHLIRQDLSKDGALTPWALVYQPEGSDKRQIVCGCETLRKKALVGSKDGKVQEVVSHGVGSVFCPPEFRGRGYAGRMMADLGKKLKSWQADNGKHVLFSVLYSDIGKQFYAARGWQGFPSAHVSLPAASPKADGLPSVHMLKSQDLAELCAIDDKLVRTRLSTSSGEDRTAVALLPDTETMQWHHAREEFVGKELLGKPPVIKGAITGEKGSRVWCYWTRVWTNPQEEGENTLHILRLVIEDEAFSDFAPASTETTAKIKGSQTAKAIAALFAAAQTEAAQWDMHEVQIWNPTSTTLAAAQLLNGKAAVDHRQDESITSLRWYGEGSWENVDWVCNENLLHVLRLVIENEASSNLAPAPAKSTVKMRGSQTAEAITVLLATAQTEAAHWEMHEMQIWNPTLIYLSDLIES